MRTRLFYILLAFFLTLGVTDFLWMEILCKDQVVAEIEKELESEEEFREKRESEGKFELPDFSGLGSPTFQFTRCISNGFVKHGKSYSPIATRDNPKIYLRNMQFRIPS